MLNMLQERLNSGVPVALINLKGILNNAIKIKGIIGNAKLCAVVKSDAYGHGLCECASVLNDVCDYFAVYSVNFQKFPVGMSNRNISDFSVFRNCNARRVSAESNTTLDFIFRQNYEFVASTSGDKNAVIASFDEIGTEILFAIGWDIAINGRVCVEHI